jgi:formylglycine-generating enzyme required for sulfatase activity
MTLGVFTMGTQTREISALMERFGGDREWYEEETPQHDVDLPRYYIGRYPVTVAQFRAFVKDSHFQPVQADCLEGVSNHPVAWVSWHEALAYCSWLTNRLRQFEGLEEPLATLLREKDWAVTLPSEAEWEKVARGDDVRRYAWGKEPHPDRANYNRTAIGTTSTIGCFPGGASPYGVEDLGGNV